MDTVAVRRTQTNYRDLSVILENTGQFEHFLFTRFKTQRYKTDRMRGAGVWVHGYAYSFRFDGQVWSARRVKY